MKNNGSFSSRVQVHALRWADLAVFPLVLGLSILPLLWFGRNWVVPPDGSWYLLLGWNLISGQGYTAIGEVQTLRGPILPGLLGLLTLVLGREVEGLVWAVRLLALANPLLMYFLVKRIAGPIAGLLAAAMVAVFGYIATSELAFSIDAVQLTVFLLSVLVLLIAAQKNDTGLSLLSGLLLGAAILTKETSFVILPLALFTMLLFGWSFRGLLLHYAGVAAVSLPWWVWVWAVSGEVYMAGRLPPGLVIPVIATLTLTALFLVRLRRSNIFARFLESERERQWASWLMVLVWAAAFSVLLLGSSITEGRVEELRSYGLELLPTHTYVTENLLEPTPLWYLLPLAGVYVLWKTVRNSQVWGFYLALLVLQIPVSLLVLILQYGTRHWLVLQTLLYGALAGFIVEIFRAAIRQGGHNLLWLLAFGAAAGLVTALTLSTASQVRLLHTEEKNRSFFDNQANFSVYDMHNWLAENVPERENILTTPFYAEQLIFLDGAQHEWAPLKMDGCVTNPIGQRLSNSCLPSKDIAQMPPQSAVWFKMYDDCSALALSMPNLMQQMQQSDSAYLLVTEGPCCHIFYPSNIASAPFIESSGAFEPVYSSYLPGTPTGQQSYGLTLLKPTGRSPASAPTQMDVNTVKQLISCEQAARGEEYAESIRSAFPHGIEIIGDQLAAESLRPSLEQIYRTP